LQTFKIQEPMVSYTKYLDIEIFEGEISKHQYPWHFHNCYTIIIVEKGSVIYEFKDKSLEVDEAEALIIEPYKIHRNTISQSTVYKAIFLPQEYFEHVVQNKLVTLKVNQQNGVGGIIDLLNKVKLNYSKREIKEIVFELSELINYSKTEKNDASLPSVNIIPKIDYDLTIEELAEKAHLSKFHFQRKFKKKCGLTIGQLKQQEKTIKAKTLLENGTLSTDVAYGLGFSDQSHFIKYFRKMWVITPKYFKK
jgi:AraC-like DNA-binding protein